MSTTEEPAGTAQPEEPAEQEEREEPAASNTTPRRRGIALAAVLLLALGAFGTYRTLGSEDTATPPQGASERTGTADVTYEVIGEGTVDISYRGSGDDGAAVVTRVPLPWKKTVRLPVGAAPIVQVTLGEKGGTAGCTLAVHGRHVQRATATGAFGRTTCGGEAPTAAEGIR
ncbi:hypothetical protein [Streptomyces sp. TLI_105]|uniref:hypothetical protein n=1 Tax=Streptomyces sp. TLI_105 TaxID=1881019 RepID=UPI000896B947|nr:hypothetical protein [Streptomyces sp. TLI_105]SEC09198.1 hypothetical protein SAMN05428939_1539 [Streptomyces sp. TLI_105]